MPSKIKYKINNLWTELSDSNIIITDVTINEQKHLIITLSDGKIIDAGSVNVKSIDIANALITLDEDSYTYNGSSHLPNITQVTLNNQNLILDVDYTILSAPSATDSGNYSITIMGINNYYGIATVDWSIEKAQATITGNDSISINELNTSLVETYTTNSDGQFEFTTVDTELEIVSSLNGQVTILATDFGNYTMVVKVLEGQNYLETSKTITIDVVEPIVINTFGVVWDYSLSSPILTRLTRSSDPYGFVTVVPSQEPTACIGTEGGQSDFDNYFPWKGMQRYNYVNGEIVDFVSYANGETFVYIPEFWSKIIDDSENSKMYFYISDSELENFTKHLGSGRYIGRYPCDTNFEAKANGVPKHKTSLTALRNGVKALDSNHYLFDIHCFSAIQLLYILEYANLNSQGVIGAGITGVSEIQPSGLTDILTYHTGRTSGENDESAIQYRWIENLWGNVSPFIDGVLASNVKIYFCDDYNHYGNTISSYYYDTGLELPGVTNEFIKQEASFHNGYLMPKTVGGSNFTYTCDKIWYYTGVRTMRAGGVFSQLNACGIFAVGFSDFPTDSPNASCARSILIFDNGGV